MMTERERLIELLTTEIECDIDGHGDCSMCKYKYSDKDCERHICNKLADHLLSNGVIVPPCKVGTKVYIAYEEHINQVFGGAIVSYSLDAAHLWFNCHYTCGLNIWHPIEDLGKTVFLTKEEAERALKERSEGE